MIKLKVCDEIKGENVGFISPPMGPNLRPDQGRPTLKVWRAPVTLRDIKERWGPQARTTRFGRQSAPPLKTLIRYSEGRSSDGKLRRHLHPDDPCTARCCLAQIVTKRT
jgi:hypothetical protein